MKTRSNDELGGFNYSMLRTYNGSIDLIVMGYERYDYLISSIVNWLIALLETELRQLDLIYYVQWQLKNHTDMRVYSGTAQNLIGNLQHTVYLLLRVYEHLTKLAHYERIYLILRGEIELENKLRKLGEKFNIPIWEMRKVFDVYFSWLNRNEKRALKQINTHYTVYENNPNYYRDICDCVLCVELRTRQYYKESKPAQRWDDNDQSWYIESYD